jgi:diguanylate cyclase (GGDEF)-like protein
VNINVSNFSPLTQHCQNIRHILIVEDSLTLSHHLKEQIDRKFSFDCDTARTKQEAEERIRHKRYDLIISDINLPDCDGKFIRELINNGHRIIVMTGVTDEEKRSKIITLPIVDYVVKNDAKTLVNYLTRTIQRLNENQHTVIGICDDSATSRQIMIHMIESQNLQYIEFEDGQQVIDYLSDRSVKMDILLTDYLMPNIDGLELVRRIRHTFLSEEFPILSISASERPHILAQFLKAGANDYIPKNAENEEFLTRLNMTLDHLYTNRRNQSLMEELGKAATHDFLTQLYNRTYFFSQIPHITANASRQKKPYGILMLDIDHFKKINDTYGHYAGDKAIQHLAMVLMDISRTSDYCFRWGGEEFLILIPICETSQELLHFGERIRNTVEKSKIRIAEENFIFQITISIGGILGSDNDVQSLISKADEMLYTAKKSGRNCVKIYEM